MTYFDAKAASQSAISTVSDQLNTISANLAESLQAVQLQTTQLQTLQLQTLQLEAQQQVVSAVAEEGPIDIQPLFSPQFDITFNFIGAASGYAATANAAAAFWELAITGDLPDQGIIDDLQIDAYSGLLGFASGTDGASGVLANAGARGMRSSNLAYTGDMGVDPADVNNAGLRDIIVHEIGHILFLPTSGTRQGLIAVNAGNYFWTGANAVAEYRLLAGNAGLSNIPLGLPGDNGHWDETIFGAELLTPYYSGGNSPVSRMTLAALRDVGYQVDLGFADPYRLASQPGYQFMDDYAGNFNTTGRASASLGGRIELAEDNDWFRVSLTAGTSYIFNLSGSASAGGTLADPYLMLRALDGQILAFNDNNGTADSRITFTASVTADYFIDASSVGNGVGTYTLSFSGGGGNPVGTVTAQSTVSVAEGNAGQTLATITITRSGGTAAFSVDYATTGGTAISGTDFVAATGTVNFASGQTSQTITIAINGDTTFEQNEEFFVNFTNVSGGGVLATDRTTVTITNDDAAPTDDYSANTGTTGVVTPGAGTAGLIETSGDVDWFRVSLTAGVAYQFSVTGGSLNDPTLTLFSGAGAQLAFNDDSVGLNPRISYTPTVSGNYYLGAAAFSTGTGSYTVSMSGADDYAADVTTTGTIAPGQTRNGTIEAQYDRDWFRITLTQGVAYTFSLNGVTLTDPYLYLHDSTGSLLVQNDDANGSLNSALVYTAATSGTYYLSAAGYSAATGSYQLSVSAAGGPTESDDVITGTPDPDTLMGLGGNDTIRGLASADTLDGGANNDLLDGGLGADTLIGGTGTDTATYANATGGIIAFLGSNIYNTGEAVGDTYNSIENVTGSGFDDIVGGDNNANAVDGGGGNDWLFGGGGDDTITGGTGNDILAGGAGNDYIDGGEGLDVAYFRDSTAGVTLNLGNRLLNTGDAAGDTYLNTENLWGSDHNDSLTGDGVGNQVYGFDGTDQLFGMGGDDNMYGANGNDTIDGGTGADTFLFMNMQEGTDFISGFTSGSDRVFASQYWFGIVTPGPAAPISSALFVSGPNAQAQTAGPQFIYNTSTFALWFDPDGTGATSAINLANFSVGTVLTSNDIWRA